MLRCKSPMLASSKHFRYALNIRHTHGDVGFPLVFVCLSRSFRSADRCRLTAIHDPYATLKLVNFDGLAWL